MSGGSSSHRTGGTESVDVDMSLNYQSMTGNNNGGNGLDNANAQTRTYRGFSTPITGMFKDPDAERVDCCAMACCGVLQSDRDRYLITGVAPPSCAKRFWLHTVLPLVVFIAAGFCAIRVQDPYLNQVLSTSLVLLLLGVLIIQCFKGSWKRRSIRKDLLWTKHQLIITGNIQQRGDEESFDYDDSDNNAPAYMMGQRKRDIRTAHSLFSCYVTDVDRLLDDDEAASELSYARGNVCSYIFRCWTKACCGSLCGMHFQVCGICGLAQEGREVELLMDASQRRIDYITMQPFMEYYPNIFKARHGEQTVQFGIVRTLCQFVGWPTTELEAQDPISWGDRLSSLSRGIVSSILGFLAVVLVWSLLSDKLRHRFQLSNFLVMVAALLQSVFLLSIVYWRHTKDISVDALIKFFFCGFFLCTSLAIFFEIVVGLTLRLFMSILMAMSGIDEVEEDGFQSVLSSPAAFGAMGPFGNSSPNMMRATQSYHDFLSVFGGEHPIFYTVYLFVTAFFLAAMVEELCKYFGFRMAAYHPDFLSARELEAAADAHNEFQDMSYEDDDENDGQEGAASTPTRRRVVLPFAQQQRSMESRGAAITIAMVAVSLGFACCENLVYIFLYSDGSLSNEILVLIARSVFPIHPIAAAIQSIGVCSRDLEKNPKMNLNMILLVAVMFHGGYDFFLMWIDFIVSLDGNYVIADDDAVVASDSVSDLYSIFVSFVILIAGVWYYFRESRKQRERLAAMDREASVDRSRLI